MSHPLTGALASWCVLRRFLYRQAGDVEIGEVSTWWDQINDLDDLEHFFAQLHPITDARRGIQIDDHTQMWLAYDDVTHLIDHGAPPASLAWRLRWRSLNDRSEAMLRITT